MRLFAYVAVYVVLSTTGLVLLRGSLSHAGRSLGELLREPRLVLGAVFYGASFLAWLSALRHYKLSTIYPIVMGVGYSAVLLASAVFLGERISPDKALGMSLVGVGILLIAR